jgi:hypothetical protein
MPRDTYRRALEIRRSQQCQAWQPICVSDIVQNLGIDLRFVSANSLEGMYVKDRPARIIIGAHRPPGRQAFTCAHELGHHVFNHGTRIDEVGPVSKTQGWIDPNEMTANIFAGYLLMPKAAVDHGFSIRGWTVDNCTPIQALTVAGWLGVGYSTLVHHLAASLRCIGADQKQRLLRVAPKDIRRSVLPAGLAGNLTIVDCHWHGRAVDAWVGDFLLMPPSATTDAGYIRAIQRSETNSFCECVSPGIAQFATADGEWSVFVRISRKEYSGRAEYRHLPEEDEA